MIEDWLNNNIDDTLKYTGNSEEVHFNCPICGETRHRMYVNLYTGKVWCHNCQFGGTIPKLIQQVEGVSWTRAASIYKDVQGNIQLPDNIAHHLENEIFAEDLRKDLVKRAIPLPEEYRELSGSTNIVAKRAIKYLHSRKISDKQIKAHKFGFCVSGEYANRIIIPITENGNLRFWVARAIGTGVKMKEKSPSNEDYQISKSEVIFNLDNAAREYHSCVISEGIFDALSWGDIGISLLGKSLYEAQLNILLDYRDVLTEGIYIAIDWDARDKATAMAEELSQYFKVKIVNIPKEFDDPNKYLQTHKRADMWKLLESAEDFSEFSSLRRKLMAT